MIGDAQPQQGTKRQRKDTTQTILGINVNAMPMLMHMNAKIKQQILHMQPIETKVSPKA